MRMTDNEKLKLWQGNKKINSKRYQGSTLTEDGDVKWKLSKNQDREIQI